jgi:hypothetical protein
MELPNRIAVLDIGRTVHDSDVVLSSLIIVVK